MLLLRRPLDPYISHALLLRTGPTGARMLIVLPNPEALADLLEECPHLSIAGDGRVETELCAIVRANETGEAGSFFLLRRGH